MERWSSRSRAIPPNISRSKQESFRKHQRIWTILTFYEWLLVADLLVDEIKNGWECSSFKWNHQLGREESLEVTFCTSWWLFSFPFSVGSKILEDIIDCTHLILSRDHFQFIFVVLSEASYAAVWSPSWANLIFFRELFLPDAPHHPRSLFLSPSWLMPPLS